MYFTRSAGAVSVTGIEKVKKLTVRVVVQDCTGTVRFTDVMLFGSNRMGFPCVRAEVHL